MSGLFPSELVAAIVSGETPSASAFDRVAAHVLADWVHAGCGGDPARCDPVRLARAVARAALVGDHGWRGAPAVTELSLASLLAVVMG